MKQVIKQNRKRFLSENQAKNHSEKSSMDIDFLGLSFAFTKLTCTGNLNKEYSPSKGM